MPLKDRGDRFGGLSIFNHWIIALLIIAMLAFGNYLTDPPKDPEQLALIQIHKSIGIFILLFGAWRVIWRLISGFPPEVCQMPRWQELTARWVHYALLAIVVLMPLSGYIMSSTGGHPVSFFGLFSLPALPENKALSSAALSFHGALGNIAIAVIALHILGALKHHWIDKDATLKRMLGRF